MLSPQKLDEIFIELVFFSDECDRQHIFLALQTSVSESRPESEGEERAAGTISPLRASRSRSSVPVRRRRSFREKVESYRGRSPPPPRSPSPEAKKICNGTSEEDIFVDLAARALNRRFPVADADDEPIQEDLPPVTDLGDLAWVLLCRSSELRADPTATQGEFELKESTPTQSECVSADAERIQPSNEPELSGDWSFLTPGAFAGERDAIAEALSAAKRFRRRGCCVTRRRRRGPWTI